MARPQRRKLKFDEDSVNKLLQEIYGESQNIKAKVVRLYSKWEQKVKEMGDVAAVGDQIIKLIAAEAKNQDQKIMILKYLKEVVYLHKSDSKDDNEDKQVITSDKRNELLKMVEQHMETKGKN